jgi:hypothetical protein
MLALVKGNVVGVEVAMIGRARNDVRTSAKVSRLLPQPSIHLLHLLHFTHAQIRLCLP